MRLINVHTMKLKQFMGNVEEDYVILSHTWGKEEDEVTFQDLTNLNAVEKKGYDKIWWTCEKAKEEKINYAWVDTCCT